MAAFFVLAGLAFTAVTMMVVLAVVGLSSRWRFACILLPLLLVKWLVMGVVMLIVGPILFIVGLLAACRRRSYPVHSAAAAVPGRRDRVADRQSEPESGGRLGHRHRNALLHRVRGAQQRRLVERARRQLQSHRQSVAGQAARHADRRQSGQVRRRGEHVRQIHLQRIVGPLPQLERDRRARRHAPRRPRVANASS